MTFLLFFPQRQASLSLLLLIGFSVGLIIDMFYHSIGAHAFASVLMVYSRAFLLQIMLPARGYEVATQPTLANLGWRRFSLFSLLLIGIHHTALFFLEAGNAVFFFLVMRKVISSTLLTYVAIILTQSITYLIRRKR